MAWTDHVDIYCERHDAAFWAEPVNAVSNAAFVLVPIFGYLLAKRRVAVDWPITLLLLLAFLIAFSSFLFHTVAEVWAGAADAGSIQLFIVVYFAFAMRRFAGFAWWLAVAATAAFMAFSVVGGGALSRLVGDALNGSESYVPPLVALIVIGGLLIAAGRREAGRALAAGGVLFAVSLFFRAIDEPLCASFPLGTHFVWHILNGVLLGYLIYALAAYGVRLRGR